MTLPMDHMGSSEFLTSDVTQRVTSWTSYDEWGNITHNAVLKCGTRELDLVKTYTGHERDSVLGQYYAKARMYDTADKHGSSKGNKLGDKRFTAVDPVKGNVRNPQSLVQYTYVLNNPLMYVDPLGQSYQIVLRDKNTKQIVSGGLVGDERYIGQGYVWLRDAQNVFNQNSLGMQVIYQKKNNNVQVIVSREGRGTHALTVSIDALARQGKVQAQENGRASGVYMQLFNCLLPGADRTYVNLAQFSNLLNLEAMAYPLGDRETIENLMSYLDNGYAVGNYAITTVKSAGAGKWYEGEDTTLTPWVEVLAAITNADAPTNVANIVYDLENWQWTWGHVANTAGDVAAVSPLGTLQGITKGGKLVGIALVSGKEIKVITNTVEDAAKVVKKGDLVPDYVKSNRVPLDKETILSSGDFKKTSIKVKGAQVYKKGDKYYYRDTFHKGEAAHLEVFDKKGKHLGEADPITGELIPGTADSTKKINV